MGQNNSFLAWLSFYRKKFQKETFTNVMFYGIPVESWLAVAGPVSAGCSTQQQAGVELKKGKTLETQTRLTKSP